MMLYSKPEDMARYLKSAWAGFTFDSLFVLIAFLSLPSSAQQTMKADVNMDGTEADPGFLSGSPWLWLLFIVVCIIVIMVLFRGRRNV